MDQLLKPQKTQLISNFGNGVDNLDLVTAKNKIIVTNTPDVLTEDTAADLV